MRETIGGYRILNEIGSGGFGAVYRARDPLNDRDVALKVLTDPNDLERFRREARLAYEIGHPNIIRIFHLGEDGGDSFIVMELMPASLRQILNDVKLPAMRVMEICYDIADGLRAAHEHGVIHRDIKPENILVDFTTDEVFEVKVSDFGIAHADNLPNLTATGFRFGTPGYMSPEQIIDAKRVDARADIYSFGVTFYEMLTGEMPEGMPQSPRQLLRLRRLELEKSFEFATTAIETLEHIVNKCLELDREHRYQTMDELLKALRDPMVFLGVLELQVSGGDEMGLMHK